MAAIAGIDMALWDIAGKRADLPCYSLWGGNATALETPAYTWFGGNDASPEEAAAQLDLEYKRGKRFFKMNACPPMGAIDAFNAIDQAVERLALARQTAPDARIALDWHGRLKPPEARRALERTDEFDVWFHEEPVLPKNYGVLAELHSRTSAKIALGERLTDLYQFRQVLQTGGVDILQPDLSHIGPTMGRKVAALAEAHDVGLTFHAPLGPINRTCSVHVGVTTDRYFFQECSEDMHYNDQGGSPENPPENRNGAYYLAGDSVEQYRLRDGRISIGSAPGLGLLMDEERIQAAAQDGHAWHDFMNARDLDNGLPTEW
jgi:galactonate dehydratase